MFLKRVSGWWKLIKLIIEGSFGGIYLNLVEYIVNRIKILSIN